MLELMAEPKKWELNDGDVCQVHTPFSTRAKELMELYNGLNLPLLTIDERLDVLLHVKWTVKVRRQCNARRACCCRTLLGTGLTLRYCVDCACAGV